MNIPFNTTIATEAIHPQINDPIIPKMLDILAKLREAYKENDYTYKPSFDRFRKEMSKLITDRFGFNIEVMFLDENGDEIAYTYPITLRAVNAISNYSVELVEALQEVLAKFDKKAIDESLNSAVENRMVTEDDWNKLGLTYAKSLEAYTDIKKMSKIEIDLKKAYVYNFPKELTGYIGFNINFFRPIPGKEDLQLTDKEILAIIWHELGHNFNSIEYTYKGVRNTIILTDTIREEMFKKNKSKEETVKIIYKKMTGKVDKSNSILDTTINLIEEQLAGEYLTFSDLSVTDNEMLADLFSNRFGLGGDCVSGLSKLQLLYDGPYPTFSKQATSLIKLFSMSTGVTAVGGLIGGAFGVVTGGLVVGAIGGLITLYINREPTINIGYRWFQNKHDIDYERLRRVKIDLIRQIKNHNLNLDNKKDILELLDQTDKLFSAIPEPVESIRSLVNRMFDSVARTVFNQKRTEKLYESLIDNELHAGAARLETLDTMPKTI